MSGYNEIYINIVKNSKDEENNGKLGCNVFVNKKCIYKDMSRNENLMEATKELLTRFKDYSQNSEYVKKNGNDKTFSLISYISKLNNKDNEKELLENYNFIKDISINKFKETRKIICINKINKTSIAENLDKIACVVKVGNKSIFKSISSNPNEELATKELLNEFQKYSKNNKKIQENEDENFNKNSNKFAIISNIEKINKNEFKNELSKEFLFIKQSRQQKDDTVSRSK